MPRITLPGDQWADLIDPSDLRSGDIKAYRRSMPVGGVMTYGTLDGMRDVLLRRLITNWSVELPIPRDNPGDDEQPGSLDLLPIPAYRALIDALDPYMDVFNPDPDPKPSPESAGTSADKTSSSATS
ncbi:hypothetical protein [Acrocarpospora catenulata]|uniref:hypothetical protein n=1 Tax=Acrocarpospora catenulata TaxID=2836182 RepID=UPI001BDA5A91|nr:hypothetical protein [Acrocarpospora catenulata]